MRDEDRRDGLTITPYDLADAAFVEPAQDCDECLIWQPPRTLVVIGKGSDPAIEVNLGALQQDAIPIMRRATGGCAVVLAPEMIVASFVLRREVQLTSQAYFRIFNHMIMTALERQAVSGLRFEGTSDIALGDRKIAGTAIYRNRHLVFFHAIINAAGRTELIARYLKHPPRTPHYRKDRVHDDFVTSLAERGHMIDVRQLATDVEREFRSVFPEQSIAAGEAA